MEVWDHDKCLQNVSVSGFKEGYVDLSMCSIISEWGIRSVILPQDIMNLLLHIKYYALMYFLKKEK